jgi:hypothetical protein
MGFRDVIEFELAVQGGSGKSHGFSYFGEIAAVLFQQIYNEFRFFFGNQSFLFLGVSELRL